MFLIYCTNTHLDSTTSITEAEKKVIDEKTKRTSNNSAVDHQKYIIMLKKVKRERAEIQEKTNKSAAEVRSIMLKSYEIEQLEKNIKETS